MRHETASYITLGGLAVLAVVVTMASHNLSQLDGKLAREFAFPNRKDLMQQYKETVKRDDGRIVEFITTRQDGESDDQFWTRHTNAVNKAKTGS